MQYRQFCKQKSVTPYRNVTIAGVASAIRYQVVLSAKTNGLGSSHFLTLTSLTMWDAQQDVTNTVLFNPLKHHLKLIIWFSTYSGQVSTFFQKLPFPEQYYAKLVASGKFHLWLLNLWLQYGSQFPKNIILKLIHRFLMTILTFHAGQNFFHLHYFWSTYSNIFE